MTSIFSAQPRKLLALVSAVCVAMLAFGLYLQHGVGLNPCPMCIVQRYALVALALFAALGALVPANPGRKALASLAFLSAGFGAFVAARQTWLQLHPPEFASCGRDFYGMIENFPLQRAIPMIFKGSGDCAAIDWRFLGLSLANWSLVAFVVLALVLLVLLATPARRPRRVGDR